MPCRRAVLGPSTYTAVSPSTRVTRPPPGTRMPRRAFRKRSWPCPSRPARPTISPARTSRSTGAPSALSWMPSASSAAAPAARPFCPPAAPSMLLPVMCRTRSATEVSPTGMREATVVPDRSTLTTSLISNTSSMRCETNSTLAPRAVSSLVTTKSRSLVAMSSAEVDSSSTSTFGSTTNARATQHACRSDRESVSARRSTSTGAPRRRSSSSAARRRRSPAVVPERFAPSQTFSVIELPGTDSTSWNTVATPRARAPAGDRRSSAGAPSIVSEPESARCTPARTFTSVLLPLPFSPMIVWTSPGRRSRSARTRARVAPKDLARAMAATSGGGPFWTPPLVAGDCPVIPGRPGRRRAAGW